MNYENGTNINPDMVQGKLREKEELRKKIFEACHNMELKNKKITRREVRKIIGGSDRDLSKYRLEYHESKKMVLRVEVFGTELAESGTNDGTNNENELVQNNLSGTNDGTNNENELVQNNLSGTNDGTNNENELVQNNLSGTNDGTNNENELVQNNLSGTNDGTNNENELVQNNLSGTISNTEDEIIEETNVYFEQPVNEMEAIARRGPEIAAAQLIASKAVADYMLQNPNQSPDDLKQQVNQANAQFGKNKASTAAV